MTIADYVWKRGTIYGWQGGGEYHYRCRCGDVYVRKGKQFMVCFPDGSRQTYKKLSGFRRWEDDLPLESNEKWERVE